MKALHIFLGGCALLLAACSNNKSVKLFNTDAALPASPKYNLDGFKVITSFVNKTKATTSTLYGNDAALKSALDGNKSLAAGEVFTLVTWKQQDDEHWFGAKIPSKVQTIEVLKTGATGVFDYSRLEGKELTSSKDTLGQGERIGYILGQKPSVMP
ncbi:hypothetical protein [Mucilaginibacter celer]|uniref:Uncharacterized protein n=1 Tax=Mucilaginibacter celer TaxID=2305508 RepID=A0A494VVN8_9SPHI|nr:hypothetical protein [Mucilaginibacter celer]AYL98141.1 hypothetical protein HYN43_023895 [Mucilaginibacter celer]